MRNKVTCNPCSGRKREGNPSELSENTRFQGRPRSCWPLDNDWLTMMRGGRGLPSLCPDNGGRGGLSLAGQVLVWEHGPESPPGRQWPAPKEKGAGGRKRSLSRSECRQRVSGPIPPRQCHSDRETCHGRGHPAQVPTGQNMREQLPSSLLCTSYL